MLFDEYWKPVYLVAVHLTKSGETARDMVQEIFLKVWTARRQLVEIENARNYIYIVARNHIFNELRKKSRSETFREEILQHFTERSANGQERLEYKESVKIVHEAVKQLSEQQRAVYILAREEGLSQQEIAGRLGVSITTVKTHMSRALLAIREYILKHAGPDCLLICLLEAFL
jgi:RNA polymerase sigma-70 factor, Bacteroides expansion family 1